MHHGMPALPISSVLLCSSVLHLPDSELLRLCLNRLTWGGLDVAVVPDSCEGATHASPAAACAQAAVRPGCTEEGQQQQQPILPSQTLPATLTLPDHVELLSTPSYTRETNISSPTADKGTSLHAWLAGRTPGSVLAVSGPATSSTLLSSIPANALGASWQIDPESSPCSIPPQCEPRSHPTQHGKQGSASAVLSPSDQHPMCVSTQEADPPAIISSTMPCLSYLPQRIAHHQYFQHLRRTHGKGCAAQQPAFPQQGVADAASTRSPAAGQGSAGEATLQGSVAEAPLLVVGYVMKASREQAMAKCTPRNTDVKDTTNTNTITTTTAPAPNMACASSGGGSVQPSPPATNTSRAKRSTGGLLSLVPCSPADHAPTPSAVPTACPRLVFAPLDLGRPLEEQMPFHAILHKASDELEWSGTGEQGEQRVRAPSFSKRVQGLRAWLARHPHVPVIDPFESTEKVIDRLQLCALTGHLNTLELGKVDKSLLMGRPPMKLSATSPKYCTIWGHDASAIDEDMRAAGLTPPLILKPSVACGLPDSHSMALITTPGGKVVADALQAARMPLPAIVQQFSNHGGRVAKVYAAGDKVFYTVRPSIPDIPEQDLGHQATQATQVHPTSTPTMFGHQGFHLFDSLKSLPTASSQQAQQPHGNHNKDGLPSLDALLRKNEDALQAIARRLRAAFGLTLFGFDIIAVPVRSGGEREGRLSGDGQGDSKQRLSDDSHGPFESHGPPDVHRPHDLHRPGSTGVTSRQTKEGDQQPGQQGSTVSGRIGVSNQQEDGDVCGFQLVVIDVNYFPSYSSPGAAAHVWQAMLDRMLG
ncbi:inositol 1, 3, 4-trisphosphate 5/6-kinase-domain-containing protein [Dunaliella salina]|uniref:Inositol 1, 3, 4-trisphosphate 5/6-kinase-domain-containing protein n=1 Tax=Dunaliella salina TaxID=3046 RepID=A0ABQ7FYD9_DUNSA|nr:inositol 1, 3, 4-trisphosphate 5/6-kinase-domain-containing protein [Dunaliella salina]|eukprot:KAF5827354.1 inositol 1, 3, 4-trisphosphate 5/6-kinase-domain-containing protein [Dunaliella salina]